MLNNVLFRVVFERLLCVVIWWVLLVLKVFSRVSNCVVLMVVVKVNS